MVEMFTIVNETWIVPKHQLIKIKNIRGTYINHFFYISKTPNIVICNVRLLYCRPFGFQFFVFNEPPKTFQFYYKDSNGKYRLFTQCWRGNLIKNINDELEIKMIGMNIFEANEYPTILRTGFDAEFFGLLEKNEKDFEIIVGKNANKKMGALKNIFRAIRNKKSLKTQLFIHKELLISQSPVFEAMFRSNLEEAKTNTLKIIDFKFKTVKAAVDFFYGHDIFKELDLNDVFELFRFADKYDIEELRNCLETFCISLITPSNVHQIANYSIQMYLTKLRKYCKNFKIICLNHSIDITDSTVMDEHFFNEVWRERYGKRY